MQRILVIFIFFVATGHYLSAQENKATLRGRLTEADGEPAIGITIVLQGTNLGTVTDIKGDFEINNILPGNYTISVSGVGYKRISERISLKNGDNITFNRIIEIQTQELEELVVYGKSRATEMREQAYAIEVVEAQGFKNLSINANDILNKISGVNIRQSGGLGSDFSLSLNGLSGNQVRIFLDGVPMDYFGTSLSLNNFSANLIERIEVYKGVVPIHLSSDALGGAINVVTGKKMQSYLDASYSTGSFGTHIGSLNAQYRAPKSGFTVRLKSFYNTSQNNYKVPVNLVDFETGKESDVATEVERFHDAYRSKMVWAETGVTGTKYADQLLVGILYSDNFKEIQQPVNAIGQAKIPYGEVSTEEEKIITNFTYSKTGLLKNRLNINSYLVGVFSENISKDTSSYRYDWYGNRELRTNNTTGEIENRKTFLKLETDNYLGNFNAEYVIVDNHNVAINYSLNHLNLQGADDYKEQNNTQFSNPSEVTKQVLGTAYTNTFFDGRLKNTLFTKLYNYKIQSLETNYQGTELNPFENTRDNVGFGISSTYQFDKFQIKASYENATRFPEIIELFGDGLNYTPNPGLQPEKSRNYNLGVIFNNRSANHPLTVSVNSFIRDAEDFIIPQVQGIKVFHINNGKVLSKGIDLAGSYSFKNNLLFALNGTYLDLRDNNKWRNGEVGVENTLYRIRLPNVPYLFGNLTISYRGEDLLKDHDSFSISAIQNYVHSFFYRWENLANQDKGIVPEQWTTNLEFVYSLNNEKYNASVGISNLWDAKVYDNFQQLRPGRTFNFKLRYFVN
ncbi:MAG: TonB-dependent receptor [Cytophagales bacterium]|nr:TonB-dependent receptor [Cytophagales bacterium]